MLHQVSVSLGPGGIIDKNEQSVTSKVIAGDNFGQISLIDT